MSKKNLKVKNIVTVIIMVIINVLTIVLLNLAASKGGNLVRMFSFTLIASLVLVLVEDVIFGISILARTIRFKVKEKKIVEENANA